MADSLLRFEKITKRFPGVVALSDVSFDIHQGEIHSLCGENGAGKSTLINLCGGVFAPNAGSIYLNDREVKIGSSKKSEELGISIVYQEVPLCANMSISDNIFLGPHPASRGLLLDRRFMQNETAKLLEVFKLKLDPRTEVGRLSIAEQSLVQIARAVYLKPKILILDEPTSTLSMDQKDNIFQIIKGLCRENRTTVLYVSHRLEEIIELGDRVTVLRDGRYVGTRNVRETNLNEIISMMVGREIEKINRTGGRRIGRPLLKAESLTRKGVFRDITFELREGEVLGFAGFVGAGRTELMRAIFGLDPINSGHLSIDGRMTKISSARAAIASGIGLIPENRKDDALVPTMSVLQNIIMLILKNVSWLSFIQSAKANKTVNELVEKLSIKVASSRNSIMSLSGGNQQKTVIARWLSNNPRILLCDEPTRGIDVGAKKEVHAILLDLANRGVGVIVVSSELPEVLAISDRIIVMHEGRITGELSREEATEEKIMILAAALTPMAMGNGQPEPVKH